MKHHFIKIVLFLNICMISSMQIQSQNLLITSDADCILIIDGEKKAYLEANQPVTLSVSEGGHILLAITADRKFHFRDAIEVQEVDKYPVEINFIPKMKHQECLKNKKEERKNKIETYRNQKSEIIKDIAENMVLIEAGSFKMGSLNGEPDEQPVREVFLNDFYIGKYEVTQKQWMAIMEENPSHFYNCEDCPVERVHWYNAVLFCNTTSRLSGLEPYYIIDKNNQDTSIQNIYDHLKWTVSVREEANGYRLPYEAEWEFAARHPKDDVQYKYAGGNKIDKVAWTLENSNGKTHPVGEKQPNGRGLYDMSGNVWEWCNDCYSGDYYKNGEKINPKGASKGWVRVIRGGGWLSHPMHATITNRDREGPDNPQLFTGLRIVRNR